MLLSKENITLVNLITIQQAFGAGSVKAVKIFNLLRDADLLDDPFSKTRLKEVIDAKDAEKIKRDSLFETKEEIHKLKMEADKEVKERKKELDEKYENHQAPNKSLLTLIEYLELADMSEAAACGTACVISPITKVYDPDHEITYHFGEPGPVLTRLYNALQDIQYGRVEDKYGWCTVVNIGKTK